jgi:probable HAF family extracellular repeat protein
MLRGNSMPLILDSNHRTDSDAYGVSGDGRVVVGVRRLRTGHAEAFRWTAETGMTSLGCLPGHATSSAYAVSADGKVIVGCSSNYTTTTAFRWSDATGMVALGDQEGPGGDSAAYAVSADGAVVAGSYSNRRRQDAVIWEAANAMRRVRELLPTELVRGWRLQIATAVSADGNVVAGAGKNPLGNREAWVARIDSGRSDELSPLALHDATESPNVQ